MRGPRTNHFLALSLVFPFILQSAGEKPNTIEDGGGSRAVARRVLHQPFFPAEPAPPPPPDQRDAPDSPEPYQIQRPPASDSSPSPLPGAARPARPARPASKPAKKVAVAVSVGIAALGMLSALAFFLYRHRAKHGAEHAEPRRPLSNILYSGAVEPLDPPPAAAGNAGEVARSSHCKSGFIKRLDRDRDQDPYRRSPELQPLPPLAKLPTSGSLPSPSDDESRGGTAFHTPSALSLAATPVRNDEDLDASASSRSLPNSASPAGVVSGHASAPRSKTSSPKQRFAVSPTDANTPIPPSRRQQPLPPPPPPPPPPRWTPSKPAASKTCVSSTNSHALQKQLPEMMPREEDDGSDIEEGKLKLKPLHWDKVKAASDGATVWDQLRSSSFQLNEGMMESLFGCNSTNDTRERATRKPIFPLVERESGVLDPKKSQNIAILLRALNVSRDEVAEALLDGNLESLGAELLETLVKMAPTKEEEIKLQAYDGEISKLGSAERFLKAVLDIPFAFMRAEAMLYRANFDAEVQYLRKSYQTLEAASEELKNSQLFLKLLQAVLRTGNRMNVGTNFGDAMAFKLDTLLKLADIKGADGKTTLLHFVLQEINRSEGTPSDDPPGEDSNSQNETQKKELFTRQGLQVVAGLSRELGEVKKAAGMDSAILSSNVSKLESGLEKVRLVMKHEMPDMEGKGKFFDSMKGFLGEAEEEIAKTKVHERKALTQVKVVTEYFHGDAAQEEAHPLRIFTIVRDFLCILDHVCKEVGGMKERAMVGSGRLRFR